MANPNIYALQDLRWNNAGTTYNGIWMDFQNGASGSAVGAAASRPLRLSNNGTDFFGVELTGNLNLGGSGGNIDIKNNDGSNLVFIRLNDEFIASGSITLQQKVSFNFNDLNMIMASPFVFGWSATSGNTTRFGDTLLARDAAGVIAQRNGTNPQILRIYNTTDSPPTNYERMIIGWDGTNDALVKLENGGTGSARNLFISAHALNFQIDSTTFWSIATGGTFQASSNFDFIAGRLLVPSNGQAGIKSGGINALAFFNNGGGQTVNTFIPLNDTWQWGAPDIAAPVAQTMQVQSVVAGTSNTAGSDWTFISSKSTGNALGGNFIWQGTSVGTSGTSQNTAATVMKLTANGSLTLNGTNASKLILSGTAADASNSGTGAVITLAHNTLNNKQFMFGDFDYIGSNIGVFNRFVSVGGGMICDSCLGDFSAVSGFRVSNTQGLAIDGGAFSPTIQLLTEASGIMAQRATASGGSSQTFRIYNTADNTTGGSAPTNYERLAVGWGTPTANASYIGTESGGTGSPRDFFINVGAANIVLRAGGNNSFAVSQTGPGCWNVNPANGALYAGVSPLGTWYASNVFTVASLPAAATAGNGAHLFVSDATATTFNTTVAGTGANHVPVFSDGTQWRIG